MTESEGSSGAPAAPGPDSALGRIVGVFLSPARTFRAIAAKPTWLAPLVLWMAVMFLLGVLVTTRSDMRSLIKRKTVQQGQKLSDNQLDEIVERYQKFAWISEGILGLVPAVIALATAGTFWALCNAFALEIRFRSAFAVTVHAFLPHVLGGLALFAILWNKTAIDPETVEDFLPTHLGSLISKASSPPLHSLLSSIDLLSFWTMALLVLGLSAATNAPRRRIAALVLSVWAVYVLGKAGIAAIFA